MQKNEIVAALDPVINALDDEIKQVELILEEHGASHTPGRFPEWRKE